MIITKRELLEMCTEGFKSKKIVNRLRISGLAINELLFIKMIKQDLKWTLEPIRKNTYIVH